MSKYKILCIALVVLAALAVTWAITRFERQETPRSAAAKKTAPAAHEKEQEPVAKDSANASAPIDLKIRLFEKKPDFGTLTEVENVMARELSDVGLQQRYKILAQWQQILVPKISHLDPGQRKLLTLYEQNQNTAYLDNESNADRQKRLAISLMASLNPSQKVLYKELLLHEIEIIEEEETGPVFHLKPSYWKKLFAPHFPEADQKFWEQTALENDPVVDYDAGLAIDRQTLGDWAFCWEQYLKRYPNSHYQQQARNNYRTYMSYLLTGLENTPTLDSETKNIAPEVETDFDAISKRHPDSRVAKNISLFRKKLKDLPGKETDLYNLANSVIKI
ncbi:hypothetical protein [Pedobacter nutrimenti]|nr:hypothetical protein [Pedobacter nutrimenti]